MLPEDKYFKELTEAELWQRYCGFLDLSISEFMDIQKELLMDEIERVADSTLGKKIMGNKKPKSVEEFRQIVPLTTYDDYEPYLSQKQEDALAEKPYVWCHSSGRGEYFKWIPHSSEIIEKTVRSYVATFILASCSKKGEVNIKPGLRVLAVLAPPPYASGTVILETLKRFSLRVMPPVEEAETAEFQERIASSFRMALKEGVDFVGSMASVLVRIGEGLTEQAGGMKFSWLMLHPKVAYRLLRAWLRSKRENRAVLPKDIWQPRGVLVSGVDTAIYRDRVAYYWGVAPYELYSGTEVPTYAIPGWNRKGMIFLPDFAFLEFIPYEELLEHQDDKDYQPSTVLLDELKEGSLYEVVVTNFYGMPLLRYRLNDIIQVIIMKDDETGIELPQIAFQRRAGEVINLGGFSWLDEKTIWQAIVNTGIKYTEWTACKEYDQNQTFLRIYLELKEEKEASDVEAMIDEQLLAIDTEYKYIHSYLGLQPVRVTLVSEGTFQRYMEEKIKEGANLAHLKPIHVNPPETVIRLLRKLSNLK